MYLLFIFFAWCNLIQINCVHIFRNILRTHPTSNMCTVSQYRKRTPFYLSAEPISNTVIGKSTDDTIVDDTDVLMDHGEVAWESNHTISTVPRIPVMYLWAPLFGYRFFVNRNSSQLSDIARNGLYSLAPYLGMHNYEECEVPFWEEPTHIVFLFL
jgi:hypothetical protein